MLRYSYLSKHNATKWLLIASLCDELVDHLPLCSKTSKASQKWLRMFTKGKFAADLVPEASIFASFLSCSATPPSPPPPASPTPAILSPPRHSRNLRHLATTPLSRSTRACFIFFSQAQITLRTKRGAAHSLSLPESFC